MVGAGCGRSWCFECGKKFCAQYIDPATGIKASGARESHNKQCCTTEVGFNQNDYCPGNHNSHCEKRW